MGFCLGADVVSGQTCKCGSTVLPYGHHGLPDGHHVDGVLVASHDIIARTIRSIGIPAILEPPGLLRGDGKRPDGTTLIP